MCSLIHRYLSWLFSLFEALSVIPIGSHWRYIQWGEIDHESEFLFCICFKCGTFFFIMNRSFEWSAEKWSMNLRMSLCSVFPPFALMTACTQAGMEKPDDSCCSSMIWPCFKDLCTSVAIKFHLSNYVTFNAMWLYKNLTWKVLITFNHSLPLPAFE